MKSKSNRALATNDIQTTKPQRLAGIPDATSASLAIPDPLRIALANYRYGQSLFELADENRWNNAGGEQAVIDATYGAPFQVLEEWEGPATTKRGALEALELILLEAKFHANSSLIAPMAKAVVQFIKNWEA